MLAGPDSEDAGLSADLNRYIGRERIEWDEVSVPRFRKLAALLDKDPQAVAEGQDLPLGWSCLLFPEVARQSEIGRDGHAMAGDFLPPTPFPNRRFAGRTIELRAALSIGERVRRRSVIDEIQPKQGKSGPLVFVTIRHEISGAGGAIAYVEAQRVVYLHETRPSKRPAPPLPEPIWQEHYTPDSISLFRYSALTFNAHRIHYDLPYARDEEKYPQLVVNGGLTTLKLLDMVGRHFQGKITGYDVRAVSPLFAGRPVSLCGAHHQDGLLLWALSSDDQLAMTINVKVQ